MSNEQEEFDLEKFADLFDTAMSSKNPAVQRAFKNLMMIAALVDANDPAPAPGPMRKLIEDVKRMSGRIDELVYNQNYNNRYTSPAVGNQWAPGSGMGPLFPGTIIGSGPTYTSTGTSTIGAASQSSFTMADIDKMKLYFEDHITTAVDYESILNKWEKKYD